MSVERNEHSAPPQHTVRLVIEEGVYPFIDCPFDPADQSRPCWPHTEFGEPFSAEKGTSDGCVYKDWVENEGIEAFTGKLELSFALAAADWRGDHFDFSIGEQVTPTHNEHGGAR